MTPQQQPHAVRFGLLTHLCYALGQQGCASMLLHPRRGEAVLYVPHPYRPKERLGVGAVEHQGRWMFTYGSQWSLADDVAGTAARIIAVVSA